MPSSSGVNTDALMDELVTGLKAQDQIFTQANIAFPDVLFQGMIFS